MAKNWAMIIPQYVSNTTVLGVMDILSWLPVDEDTIENNAKHNLNQLKGSSIFDENSYIENQALWENIKFGESDMAYSGCEIIATYNAIKALGGESSPQHMTNLISYYEKNGASLKGEFGVVAYAIADYFKKQGYNVETSADKKPEIINAIADRSSTIIVTVYNDDRDIMEMIHTVSITKEEGKYVVHNGYNKDKPSQAEENEKNLYWESGRYDSVQEAIDDMNKSPEGGEASLIYIIGISES